MIKDFLNENLKEIIIGTAIATIIAILANLDIKQGLTLVLLGALSSLILKQLLINIEFLKANHQTALIILFLIGGFFLLQGFQLGIYSTQAFDTAIEPQSLKSPSAGLTAKTLAGFSSGGILATLGSVATLGFFVNPWVGIVLLILFFIFFGIPLIGLSIAIFQNFQLIIIMFGLISLAFLVFKTKRIKSVTS